MAGVGPTSPVGISVYNKLSWGRSGNCKTMAKRSLKIEKNPLGTHKMNVTPRPRV